MVTTTPSASTMNPEVKEAVAQLRASFPGVTVTSQQDSDGGAIVTMYPIDPGPSFGQSETWLKFAISYQYPYSDLYPLFVRVDLTRADGGNHGPGITVGSFCGEPALQLSRRSNRRDPALDTAARKVARVIEWLQKQ